MRAPKAELAGLAERGRLLGPDFEHAGLIVDARRPAERSVSRFDLGTGAASHQHTFGNAVHEMGFDPRLLLHGFRPRERKEQPQGTQVVSFDVWAFDDAGRDRPDASG